MGSPLFTASGGDRVTLCEGAAVLPHVGSITEDASRGHAIHAFLEAVPKVGREAALADAPEDVRPFCETLPLERLPTDPTKFAAEVAFALDTVTLKARELGRGVGRRYDCTPTEVAGTADVVALVDDDAVLVDDYKSGWSVRPRASQSFQLRFYGLAAARAYGRTRAILRMTRLMEDGEVYVDEAVMDAFDLDSFALDVAALASSIEGARKLYAEGVEPALTEGSHCRWCPAFARCPAKTALVAGPFPDVDGNEITPHVAARAYEKIRLYRQALDRAEEIIKDYARTTPIPLPDGQVYGVRYDDTKRIDGEVAAKVLRGMGLEGAIKQEVTQASIKAAIKSTGHRLADVLTAIEHVGGLRTTKAPKLVAHKPKSEAA